MRADAQLSTNGGNIPSSRFTFTISLLDPACFPPRLVKLLEMDRRRLEETSRAAGAAEADEVVCDNVVDRLAHRAKLETRDRALLQRVAVLLFGDDSRVQLGEEGCGTLLEEPPTPFAAETDEPVARDMVDGPTHGVQRLPGYGARGHGIGSELLLDDLVVDLLQVSLHI